MYHIFIDRPSFSDAQVFDKFSKLLRTCPRGSRSYNRLQFIDGGWLGPWDPELEDLEPTQQAIETSMNARWRKVRQEQHWRTVVRRIFGCTDA